MRNFIGVSVFDAAVSRLAEQYEAGHRIVISISGGKDSTVTMECAVIAATMTGRLPVEAATRDEEIAYPGTYEYLERVAAREDVSLRWNVAPMPIVNAFNRQAPYWWPFDPLVPEDQWVRKYPPFAEHLADLHIRAIVSQARYPVEPGQYLYDAIGLRVQESRGRALGIASAGGHLVSERPNGARGIRPVYDWTDGDVWKAISMHGWDYNTAYDSLHRKGVPRSNLRVGPPTMNVMSMTELAAAAQAWPNWFDRVAARIDGIRTAVQYGKRVLMADRRHGETWQQTFERECVERAPQWISERAVKMRDAITARHRNHSTTPFQDSAPCLSCGTMYGSWRLLTRVMYLGDPFSMKTSGILPYVEPEFFRAGAGRWTGAPI